MLTQIDAVRKGDDDVVVGRFPEWRTPAGVVGAGELDVGGVVVGTHLVSELQ